jgi:hypothetical protein
MRIALIALLLLTGCASGTPGDYRVSLQNKSIMEPEPERFQHCHGYGCQYKTEIALTEKDWKEISKTMKKAKDASAERLNIKKAIGMFETKVGAIAGTSTDIHGTFKKLGRDQLDCSDESLNTTMYLVMMDKKGLLKFHAPSAPDGRVPIIHSGFWPHRTATIVEKETGTVYAVDSWFWDNGQPAEIVPLDKWKAGWKPDNFKGG